MQPAIELRLLRYVVAVAEELHFSRAALRVHVAQPSLSKQIRELEESLGVLLFDRTNREVHLTEAGRLFVKEAEKALAHSEHAVELARQANSTDNGNLLVGYTPGMNLKLLFDIRHLCLAHRREFSVNFHSSPSAEQIESLLSGSIHAGLVLLPVRNESLVVESLIRETVVAVLPQSHSLALRRELGTKELGNTPVILRARRLHPASYDRLQKLFRKAGFTPRIAEEVATVEESLSLVNDGIGIAFVKLSAIPPGQRIAYAKISDVSLFEETGLVYRRDNRSNKLKAFVAFLRTHSPELVAHCQSEDGAGSLNAHSDSRQLKLF